MAQTLATPTESLPDKALSKREMRKRIIALRRGATQSKKEQEAAEEFRKIKFASIDEYQAAYEKLPESIKNRVRSLNQIKAQQRQRIASLKTAIERAKMNIEKVKKRKIRDTEDEYERDARIQMYKGQMEGLQEGLEELKKGKIIDVKEIKKYALQKGDYKERKIMNQFKRSKAAKAAGFKSWNQYVKAKTTGLSQAEIEELPESLQQKFNRSETKPIVKVKKLPPKTLSGVELAKELSKRQNGSDIIVSEEQKRRLTSEVIQKNKFGTIVEQPKIKGIEDLEIVVGSYITKEDNVYKKVSPKEDFLVLKSGKPLGEYTKEKVYPSKVEFTTTGEKVTTFNLGDEHAFFKDTTYKIDPFKKQTKVQKTKEKIYLLKEQSGLKEFSASLSNLKGLASKKILTKEQREIAVQVAGQSFDFVPGKWEFEKPIKQFAGSTAVSLFMPETYGEAGVDIALFGAGGALTEVGEIGLDISRKAGKKLFPKFFEKITLREGERLVKAGKTAFNVGLGGLFTYHTGKEVLKQPTAELAGEALGKELRAAAAFTGGAYAVEASKSKKIKNVIKELQEEGVGASLGIEMKTKEGSGVLVGTKRKTDKAELETLQAFEILDSGQVIKGKGKLKLKLSKNDFDIIPNQQFTFSGRVTKSKGRLVKENADLRLTDEIPESLDVYHGFGRVVTEEKIPQGSISEFGGIAKEEKNINTFIIGEVQKRYKKKIMEYADILALETKTKVKIKPSEIGKIKGLSEEEAQMLKEKLISKRPIQVLEKIQSEASSDIFKDLGLTKTPSKHVSKTDSGVMLEQIEKRLSEEEAQMLKEKLISKTPSKHVSKTDSGVMLEQIEKRLSEEEIIKKAGVFSVGIEKEVVKSIQIPIKKQIMFPLSVTPQQKIQPTTQIVSNQKADLRVLDATKIDIGEKLISQQKQQQALKRKLKTALHLKESTKQSTAQMSQLALIEGIKTQSKLKSIFQLIPRSPPKAIIPVIPKPKVFKEPVPFKLPKLKSKKVTKKKTKIKGILEPIIYPVGFTAKTLGIKRRVTEQQLEKMAIDPLRAIGIRSGIEIIKKKSAKKSKKRVKKRKVKKRVKKEKGGVISYLD